MENHIKNILINTILRIFDAKRQTNVSFFPNVPFIHYIDVFPIWKIKYYCSLYVFFDELFQIKRFLSGS